MTTDLDLRARRAKEAYELKKVQQRIAAIIFFTISYHCVFALIVLAKIIQNQGRPGDAYGLVFMSGVLALMVACGVRKILGHPMLSAIWTPLALAPPVIAAIWVL